MGKHFDKYSRTKYLAYLDANTLYGWAMCKPLPVENFEWMSEEELRDWKNHSYSSSRPSGCETSEACILEVDLEYPEDLHDLHNDYPLALLGGVEKLIPNLGDKKKYIIHHESLTL